MPVLNNALAGAAGSAGGADSYTIERSLRFDSNATSYLRRTPSAAGNRKTWTWSGWIKTTTSSTYRALIEGYGGTPAGSNRTSFQLNNAGKLHLLFDNGNSGQLQTNAVFKDPTSWFHVVLAVDTSQSTPANRVKIYINGKLLETSDYSTASYPNQDYLTGINNDQPHYINRVVDPLYGDWSAADIHLIDGQQLAATDFGEEDSNGVWQPKKFTGTYRTGVIYSDHTVCNGMTNTSKLSELYNSNTGSCQGINLKGNHEASLILTYDIPNVTKITIHSNTGSAFSMVVNEGLSDEYSVSVPSQNNVSIADHFTGFTGTLHTLKIYGNAAGLCLNAIAINDVVLVDGPGRNSFHLPFTNLTDLGNDSTFTEPTNKPTQGMEAVTWVGNGGTQTVNCGFQPDLVWLKQRNGTARPLIFNSIEGATKGLHTNGDEAQFTDATTLTAFTSNGFTLGSHGYVNGDNGEYAGWAWKGGGTAVTNNAGSVTSTVCANNDYGF